MSIYEKIVSNYYVTKIEHPTKPLQPMFPRKRTPEALRAHADAVEAHEAAMIPFRLAYQEYAADQRRLNEQFKADCIDDVFGDDAKRFPTLVNELWRIAYEHGHSSGDNEIYNYLMGYTAVIEAVKTDLAKAA